MNPLLEHRRSSAVLAVLIPSHSRADLLVECLTSLARAGALSDSRFQVHVIDDGSPAGIITRTARQWPGVVVHRQEPARGFCAAVNLGLRSVATPFVQLLNDDAEVTPGWAELPLQKLHADPRVGAVTPLILQWPGGRIDSAGDEYDPGGFARKRGHGRLPQGEFLVPGPAGSASGCASFYRRPLLLRIGGFPESFGAYFDDVDVSCRLRQAGATLWYEPGSRILHRGSASYGRRPTAAALARQSRNEEWLFWRNRRSWLDLPRHGLVLAGKAYLRLGDGTLRPFLEGRLRAWAALFSSSTRQALQSPRPAKQAHFSP